MPRKRGLFNKSTNKPKQNNNTMPARRNSNLPANTNSTGGSLLSNLAFGATIGAGSSLGHRAIDSVMGSGQQNNNSTQENNNPNQEANISCEKLLDMYHLCLKNENNNCNYITEILNKKCNI